MTVFGPMPGWQQNSYGYHSDDGAKFTGAGHGVSYGPTFGPGDTVGVGLVYYNAPPPAGDSWTDLDAEDISAEAYSSLIQALLEKRAQAAAPAHTQSPLNGRDAVSPISAARDGTGASPGRNEDSSLAPSVTQPIGNSTTNHGRSTIESRALDSKISTLNPALPSDADARQAATALSLEGRRRVDGTRSSLDGCQALEIPGGPSLRLSLLMRFRRLMALQVPVRDWRAVILEAAAVSGEAAYIRSLFRESTLANESDEVDGGDITTEAAAERTEHVGLRFDVDGDPITSPHFETSRSNNDVVHCIMVAMHRSRVLPDEAAVLLAALRRDAAASTKATGERNGAESRRSGQQSNHASGSVLAGIASSWPRRGGLSIFYTLNGHHLGCAFTDVDPTKSYYPCVGIDAPWYIDGNFGDRPFVFDIRQFEIEMFRSMDSRGKVFSDLLAKLDQRASIHSRDNVNASFRAQILPLSIAPDGLKERAHDDVAPQTERGISSGAQIAEDAYLYTTRASVSSLPPHSGSNIALGFPNADAIHAAADRLSNAFPLPPSFPSATAAVPDGPVQVSILTPPVETSTDLYVDVLSQFQRPPELRNTSFISAHTMPALCDAVQQEERLFKKKAVATSTEPRNSGADAMQTRRLPREYAALRDLRTCMRTKSYGVDLRAMAHVTSGGCPSQQGHDSRSDSLPEDKPATRPEDLALQQKIGTTLMGTAEIMNAFRAMRCPDLLPARVVPHHVLGMTSEKVSSINEALSDSELEESNDFLPYSGALVVR
jgi:hypothetical protein